MGAVLLEQDEHWQLEGRRMFSPESMAAIPSLDDLPALQAAGASRGISQAPGDRGLCAPTGRSGFDRRPGAGTRSSRRPTGLQSFISAILIVLLDPIHGKH